MTAPSSDSWNLLVIVYSVCFFILYLKYVVVIFVTADGANHPKEDGEHLPKLIEGEHGLRLKRLLANDVENLPMQSTIFWGALLIQIWANASGNGKHETSALTVLVIVYTISRVAYSIFYYFALQPFRSIVFMTALFATLATAVLTIINASQIDFGQIFP
eukprot:gene1773-1891_t